MNRLKNCSFFEFSNLKNERDTLVFYKPNYCCNCGEKIERVNWSLTTSRRFCDICQTDFVAQEWLPKIFVGLMALVGMFGAGIYLRAGEKPLNASTRQVLTNSPNPDKKSAGNSLQAGGNSNIQRQAPANDAQTNASNASNSRNLIIKPPVGQIETTPGAGLETVFFCGAATKKGTPCSRRVKGGGRCWQHKGQAAMLPAERLIADK